MSQYVKWSSQDIVFENTGYSHLSVFRDHIMPMTITLNWHKCRAQCMCAKRGPIGFAFLYSLQNIFSYSITVHKEVLQPNNNIYSFGRTQKWYIFNCKKIDWYDRLGIVLKIKIKEETLCGPHLVKCLNFGWVSVTSSLSDKPKCLITKTGCDWPEDATLKVQCLKIRGLEWSDCIMQSNDCHFTQPSRKENNGGLPVSKCPRPDWTMSCQVTPFVDNNFQQLLN